MIDSKAWNWKILDSKTEKIWREPSIESFYLVNRWKQKGMKTFLDLGCGLGRHSILFGMNDFAVKAFDLSKEAVNSTKEWAENMELEIECIEGDMLRLPYEAGSIDCIYCKNVISHSDTEGVKQIINEINRVLKSGGECYLTLCSKETWGFKQDEWPFVDLNTKIRMDEGPEKGVPHFYADYELIKELFKKNKLEMVQHIEEFYEADGRINTSYHYHVLIQKY